MCVVLLADQILQWEAREQEAQEAQEATHQGRLVGVGRGNKSKPAVVGSNKGKGRPVVDDNLYLL